MNRIALVPLATLAAGLAPSFVTGAAAQDYSVHPSTQDPAVRVTLTQLEGWETELSNWGRWGPNDQIGTLNLITPEKTRQATRLVTDGVTVTLGHFVNEEDAIDSQTFAPTEIWMTSIDPQTGLPRFALDAVSFSLHDGQLSHLDALCHYRTERDGKFVIFNGYPQNLDADGCKDLAIDRMGPGYVTRGVLVDLPHMRGLDWLEPSTPIYVSDLEAWEEYAGVEVSPGDALLVRTGRWAKREQEGPLGVWAGRRRPTRFGPALASRARGLCSRGRRGQRRPAIRRRRDQPSGPPDDPGLPRASAGGQRLPGGRGSRGGPTESLGVHGVMADHAGSGRHRGAVQRDRDVLNGDRKALR